jgi:hypothetical protein
MDEADEAKLHEAMDKLDADLRRAGVYTEHMDVMPTPDGVMLLVVNATVGDIAFSKRVHEPDEHEIDSEFRGIVRDQSAAEMQSMRDEAKTAAETGEGFWDDDEEDELP